jgi:5-hydroxyisourate hydrolase-like protein (transthyretin family)
MCLAFALAGEARAGEFTINACQADRTNFSTQAFEDFATRGMMWKRACDPEGPGLRGLVTSNVVRAGRVERAATSRFVLQAPDGTRFLRLRWSGHAQRRDCRYALQIWASRPDGPPTPIKNVRANRHCPRPNRGQAAGWPRPHTYDITGATKIVQRVICVGAERQPYCSARGLNYIRTFKAEATVVDVSAPTVSVVQDNPFTRGEWVRGEQRLAYEAVDNTGVRLARAVVANSDEGQDQRSCNYAQRVPCSSGPGAVTVDTQRLTDGSQPLAVHAEDAGGNLGASAALTVRVDNSAPGAVPVVVHGGEGWRNTNDFDLGWTNPDEGDRAPITAAHYRLCRSDGSDCRTAARAEHGISRLPDLAVPEGGEWQLRLWREDAAGNQEPANASITVSLRYDGEAPRLGFEPSSPSDPTLVSVVASDRLSGVAGGQIELSREGSGIWQSLETQQHGERLLTRLDDARLPAGTYLLRASAHDHATNQSSTDRRLDGAPMRIILPLRASATMRAGVLAKRTVRRKIRRRGDRRSVRRRVTVLKPRARTPVGRRVRIGGRLETSDGHPVAGAEILIFTSTATAPEKALGTLQTDASGRYSYVVRADASRVLRFVYPGSTQMLPVERHVTVLVPAASSIRAAPRRLPNGRAVRFRGRLRSLPTPAAGKLVELQVVLSGRWQTFRTVRTSPDGRWSVRYRFRRSCGLVRYRFRARLPAETGYPFEIGRTRAVGVAVRGASCR